MPSPFKRILLKLSGEGFSPGRELGINGQQLRTIAEQVKAVKDLGVELALVVGGGNLVRGAELSAGTQMIQEATAHYMGMLGTVMNGLALQDALEKVGCETRLMTAIRMDGIAEPFIRRRCTRHLQRGRVVILGGGTGSPFVTTDTAAALRACEIGADVVMKATRVDGVYSDDPEKNPHAVLYDQLSYEQVLTDRLRVMDMTAIGMCMDRKIPILVFNYTKTGNIERAARGEAVGTLVGGTRAGGKAGATVTKGTTDG